MNYNSFFSDNNLVLTLCKYRAKVANKRHEKHMLRNVSLHERTNKILSSESDPEFNELRSLFPNRRQWIQLKQSERKSCKDSIKINQLRLYKTYILTKKNIKEEQIIAPDWYLALMEYVQSIQDIIFNIETSNHAINSPEIRGIKKKVKQKDDGKKILICRPIALYGIKDKIICSLTAKYFTHFFEYAFLDCSYAFRAKRKGNNVRTHHDCIEKIIDKRKKEKDLWVAECDIQKFFDTVQHDYLLKVFNELSLRIESQSGVTLDTKSKKVFQLFLDSFSFQDNVLILNNDREWFNIRGLSDGIFDWVEKELNEKFGENYTENHRIGVPQGNAISCFISNLILHNVDEKILGNKDDVFYIRYCDDMVLMHPEKKVCHENLKIFMSSLHENFLLYHEPKKTINYIIRKNSLKFWNNKSKLPFYWGNKHVDDNNIPWVSFVGYQLDFYGRIRVRKATLKKETKKQTATAQKLLKSLGKLNRRDQIDGMKSRVTINQMVATLQKKLISMSVGRINLLNHKDPEQQGLCWTNGFKILNKNKITASQLKYLDRRRRTQLKRLPIELRNIKRRIIKKPALKGILDELGFKGTAFSYYNFLKHKK